MLYTINIIVSKTEIRYVNNILKTKYLNIKYALNVK